MTAGTARPGAEKPAPVIAVDGPSGTGKGALCLALARRLRWHLLDSGALYRLVALAGIRRGLSAGDGASWTRVAESLEAEFTEGEAPLDELRVVLEGQDVTAEIRTEEYGHFASVVATMEPVRGALLKRQRAFRQPPGLIADGRDMGTVVFPDAGLKVFLTASPEARAERRYKQLKEKGMGVNLAQLCREIAERDFRDSSRTISPLRPASDATVLDTTHLGIADVFERVMQLVRERRLGD